MPIIQLENGHKLKFDDGYTEEQMGEAVDSYMSELQQPTQEQQPQAQTPQKELAPEEQRQETLKKYAPQRAEINRTIGLGTRAALEGVGGLATLPYDLATLGVNKAFDTNIPSGSQIVSEGLDTIGLPRPNSTSEKIGSAVIEAGTPGGLLSKAVQVGVKAPAIVKKLASSGNVAADTAASAGAGLGSSVAAEFSDNPLVQIGAGIATGTVSGAGAARATRPKGQTPSLLEDVKNSGLDETQAFGNVRGNIEQEAEKQTKKITTLFDSAKERGQNAFIDPSDLTGFAGELKKSVSNEIDLEGKNLINRTADVITDLSKNGLKGQNINELQSIRRSATRISSKGRPDSAAAGDLVRKIDSFFDDVEIKGDEKAAKLWKDAISTSRDYYRRFEDPKKIAQAIDSNETLEAIEKSFLGTGSISAQKDLAKTYRDTLNAVNPKKQKETGFALRQSTLNRMIKDAARSSDSGEGLSASRLSNSIRNLRRENQSFWKKFTKDERQTLTKLEDELRKTADGGVVNKAYNALEKIIRKGIRSNIELPRTLKPKTIVTVEDLLELSSIRPKPKSTAPVASYSAINQETK